MSEEKKLNQIEDNSKKIVAISFVTKKKIGNAVFRNKIKRRLRNIMLDALKSINISCKYSYLFIAKKNVFHDDYKVIKNNILKSLRDLK